jgi:hypothetical protein
MDNEEPIVWHESVVDEYWNQLDAKMKQLCIVRQIEHIKIENVEITKERLAALFDMFVSRRAADSGTVFIFNNAHLWRGHCMFDKVGGR